MIERHWLDLCSSAAPNQPATAFWRAVELEMVSRHQFPSGQGLDVGCGDGGIISLLRRENDPEWAMVGLDLDPIEVGLAAQSGQYNGVCVASADGIPYPSRTFDFAFSNSVLEHIPEYKVDWVLQEVRRVLQPGAQFIITVPSNRFHDCLLGFGGSLFAKLMGYSREEYLKAIDERLAHQYYWSSQEWERHLHASGFKLHLLTDYLTVHEVRRWETVANFTAGLLYSIWGRGKRPIEIQRALGLRRGHKYPRLLISLSRVVTQLFAAGLSNQTDRNETTLKGCLYMVAVAADPPPVYLS